MEFNDLDNPFKAQSKPSTSRFAPKSSRFQPKTKQPPVKLEPKPELEPALERMKELAAKSQHEFVLMHLATKAIIATIASNSNAP